jgi:uncharacterized protein (TIGR02231 family)
MHPPVLAAIVLAVPSLTFAAAAAPQDRPPSIEAVEQAVESQVTAVTAYIGRASVTRTATVTLQPNLYALRFTNLPETIQPQTLQARAAGPASIVGVDFEVREVERATSPRISELDGRIRELRRHLQQIEEQHKINASQGKLLDEISVRVADDATKEGGTPALDLGSLRGQIEFLAAEREKLMSRRIELDEQKRMAEEQLRVLEAERAAIAGGARQDRTALVTVAVTAPSETRIELSYLVANASWQPAYNIRAAPDESAVQIEYDAMLWQRTGEDWLDVALTLSTAQPAVAANPPAVQPWYLDVRLPEPVVDSRLREVREQMAAKAPMRADKLAGGIGGGNDDLADPSERAAGERFGRLAEEAEVGGTGPSVTFTLPRTVTVRSNAQKQQRTRIAAIDARPEFVHVTVPALTNAVYVRGELLNSSAYQLLPGPASIFIGQDYVGPTTLDSVAPQGRFKVHFGIDQAVRATRTILAKNTSSTGLFAGGRRTSYDYRIEIDNGTRKPITIEVWDRQPVSRSDQIQVELVDLSHPLAGDAEYVDEQKPLGLLKWVLSTPATATGKSALAVTYGVHISRDKDIEITPLPD